MHASSEFTGLLKPWTFMLKIPTLKKFLQGNGICCFKVIGQMLGHRRKEHAESI